MFKILLAISLFFSLPVYASHLYKFSDYQLVSISFDRPAPKVLKIVSRFQEGDDSLDQFSITRVLKFPDVFFHRKPLILLAPFSEDARYFEISQSDFSHSLAGVLANSGFDLWLVDDRVNRSQLGDCESGAVDCSTMKNWNITTRVRDAEFARTLVKKSYPYKNPVIGGFTGSGPAAIAAVNAYPTHYSGLFSTGAGYSNDPVVRAYNTQLCELGNERIFQGIYFDTGINALTPLILAARDFPNDPAPPIPGLPPGLTNHQLLILITSTPELLGSFALSPTYIFAEGDIFSDSFTTLSESSLFQLTELFPPYASVAGITELNCSLAGDTTHVDNLHAFKGDILFTGGEAGMGPFLQSTAELFTNVNSLLVDIAPGRGEANYYLATDREQTLDPMLINWLNSVF